MMVTDLSKAVKLEQQALSFTNHEIISARKRYQCSDCERQ